MNIVWHPAPGNEDAAVDALKSEGARVRGGLGLEPLTTIATVLAAAELVRVLIHLYRDARYTGVLIDATGDPVHVREMRGWPRKQVLVITPNGAQFYNAGADESPGDELGKIAKFIAKD